MLLYEGEGVKAMRVLRETVASIASDEKNPQPDLQAEKTTVLVSLLPPPPDLSEISLPSPDEPKNCSPSPDLPKHFPPSPKLSKASPKATPNARNISRSEVSPPAPKLSKATPTARNISGLKVSSSPSNVSKISLPPSNVSKPSPSHLSIPQLSSHPVSKTIPTPGVNENKKNWVIKETNLITTSSESPIYSLSTEDAANEKNVVLLIPVKPVLPKIVVQSSAKTNINNDKLLFNKDMTHSPFIPSIPNVPLQGLKGQNCNPASAVQNVQFPSSSSEVPSIDSLINSQIGNGTINQSACARGSSENAVQNVSFSAISAKVPCLETFIANQSEKYTKSQSSTMNCSSRNVGQSVQFPSSDANVSNIESLITSQIENEVFSLSPNNNCSSIVAQNVQFPVSNTNAPSIEPFIISQVENEIFNLSPTINCSSENVAQNIQFSGSNTKVTTIETFVTNQLDINKDMTDAPFNPSVPIVPLQELNGSSENGVQNIQFLASIAEVPRINSFFNNQIRNKAIDLSPSINCSSSTVIQNVQSYLGNNPKVQNIQTVSQPETLQSSIPCSIPSTWPDLEPSHECQKSRVESAQNNVLSNTDLNSDACGSTVVVPIENTVWPVNNFENNVIPDLNFDTELPEIDLRNIIFDIQNAISAEKFSSEFLENNVCHSLDEIDVEPLDLTFQAMVSDMEPKSASKSCSISQDSMENGLIESTFQAVVPDMESASKSSIMPSLSPCLLEHVEVTIDNETGGIQMTNERRDSLLNGKSGSISNLCGTSSSIIPSQDASYFSKGTEDLNVENLETELIEKRLISELLNIEAENISGVCNVQSFSSVPTENSQCLLSDVGNAPIIKSGSNSQVNNEQNSVLRIIDANVTHPCPIPSTSALTQVNAQSASANIENLERPGSGCLDPNSQSGVILKLENQSRSIPLVWISCGNKIENAASSENSISIKKKSNGSMGDLLKPLYKFFKNNKCELCGFKSKANSLNIARRHLVVHLQTKNFNCDICGKLFITPSKMRYHKKAHRSTQKVPSDGFSCSVCGIQYVKISSLKDHFRIHTGELPFVCDICEKRFRTSSILKNHVRHHHETFFPCELCPKKYTDEWLLAQHRNAHMSDSGDFKCSICNKGFHLKSNLSQHMLVHSRPRRHACEICDMRFKFPHHLRNHMAKHQN